MTIVNMRARRSPAGWRAKPAAPPDPPRKTDCPGHVAGRDDLGRYPIGDCGPDCLMRRYRLGKATWNDKEGRWE